MSTETGKSAGKKKWIIGVLLVTALPMLVMGGLLFMVVALMGGYNATVGACGPGTGGIPVTYTGPVAGSLTQLQMSRAAAVVSAGRQMGISDRGIVIALATASQESGFKVYANDGRGGDLSSDQQGIAASLKIPHDAVGTDHGSLGVFQQQWPWWGTMQELMDPATSARMFYEALVKVPGWESLPVTVAAQRVQRSAYPDAYADDQQLAEQLLDVIDSNTELPASESSVQPVAAGSDPYGLGSVTPQLRTLVDVLAPKFGITQVGGYRESARDPHGHPAGLAADFMTTTPGARGDDLAAYAQEHATELAVDYIIWKQRIWSASRAAAGWRPMEDRGGATENHLDHVHINVLPGAASTSTGGPEPQVINGVYVGGSADCVMPAGMTGQVVFPLPRDSGYVDQHNFGQTGGRWSSMHTGNDYSVACGTPVYAVTAGTVEFDSSQESWAGPNFVRISTGPGQLATWYAHMETRTVVDGQQVQAGEQIGAVGDLGNSMGCHLHFEVHPRGGSIYEDPIDPVAWLAANIGKDLTVLASAQGAPGPIAGPVGGPVTGKLRLTTANIPNRSGLSGFRSSMTALLGSNPDFITLNEVSDRSLGEMESAAPGFTAYRDPNVPQDPGGQQAMGNAVMWRTDEWAMQNAGRVKIVEDDRALYQGQPVIWDRYATWVLLQRKSDGAVVSVISVHHMTNPAKFPKQHGNPSLSRAEQYGQGMDTLLQLVSSLASHGPVLVGGDMNTHATYTDLSWAAVAKMSAAGYGQYDHGVDFVWFPKHLGVTLANGRTGAMASDHHWVSAELDMNGAGTSAGPPDGTTGIPLPVGGGDTVTMLSYNINGAADAAAVAEEITSSGSMVVALQEADTASGDFGANVRQMAQQLNMQYAYAVVGTWQGRETIDNAVLSKYPIVDADISSLPVAADTPPRGLLRVTLDLGDTLGLVDVYATHLHDAGAIRATQANEVQDEVGAPDCATVLMGDMGSTPGSEVHQVLTADLLDSFADGSFGAGNTSPASAPNARIDYVFHDLATKVVDAAVMPAGASDHRAVRATVRFDLEESC